MADNTYFWYTVVTAVLVGFSILDMMGLFSKTKNQFDVNGRTVVITGGSQGMGRGLGKLLAQKGANIVIVARDQRKLEAALQYVSSSAKDKDKQRFHAISADVTKPEENVRIISEVTEWNNGQPPDIVWANAGSSHPELFIDTPIEVLRSQMDINYFAAAFLAHATLRAWLKPTTTKHTPETAAAVPPRHFIMTSSVGCYVGLVGYAPYSPAKAAERNLADALRQEIQMYNSYGLENPTKGPAAEVKIHCVTPGTILSPGFEQENKTKPAVTKLLEESDPRQSEDEVAAAAVKGLEKGNFLIATQWLGKVMRASMLGGTVRDGVFKDTVLGWVSYVVWLIVGADLDRKVTRWGENNQVKLPQ